MNTNYLVIFTLLVTAACATNPNRAVELDTRIEKTDVVSSGAVIGVKDGNMIYQKKVILSEELRFLQISVYEAEAKLYGGPRYYDNYGMLGVLRMCREKISALGDGKLTWTEKREYVVPEFESVKMGLDEKGRLSGITEEYLKDRIDRFRGYKEILDRRSDEMSEKLDVCNAELNYKQKQIAGR